MPSQKKQFLSSLGFLVAISALSPSVPFFYSELRAALQQPVAAPAARHYLIPVLCFHDLDGKGPYSVSRHEFRAYMQAIKDAGVQVISLRELYGHAVRNELLVRPSIVITIDDDFTNIVRVAAPILREFRYPATFYVYIRDIQGSPDKGMSWEDLNRIATEGFDIQNHSFSHTKLSKPYPDETDLQYRNRIYREIIVSGKTLAERVPAFDRFSFAYPMGYHNDQIEAMLKKEGYKVLVTTDNMPIDLRRPFHGTIHRYTIQKFYVKDPAGMFREQLRMAGRQLD